MSSHRYILGKTASKYLVIEWLSFAGYAKEVSPLLHGASRTLRYKLLTMNYQVYMTIMTKLELRCITMSVELLQKKIISRFRLAFHDFTDLPLSHIMDFAETSGYHKSIEELTIDYDTFCQRESTSDRTYLKVLKSLTGLKVLRIQGISDTFDLDIIPDKLITLKL